MAGLQLDAHGIDAPARNGELQFRACGVRCMDVHLHGDRLVHTRCERHLHGVDPRIGRDRRRSRHGKDANTLFLQPRQRAPQIAMRLTSVRNQHQPALEPGRERVGRRAQGRLHVRAALSQRRLAARTLFGRDRDRADVVDRIDHARAVGEHDMARLGGAVLRLGGPDPFDRALQVTGRHAARDIQHVDDRDSPHAFEPLRPRGRDHHENEHHTPKHGRAEKAPPQMPGPVEVGECPQDRYERQTPQHGGMIEAHAGLTA
ncbi:MAG: hypothetical protein IPK20_22260 [Betaproteobacteria bacterium]|nr:hypothetical protein [Betaproteobacteria bacterium]